MFFDWKTQCCQKDYTTQGNLQIQSIPIKLPMAFFTELEQNILKLVWKHKRSWIAKAILKKKKENGRIKLPDFRQYYKAAVIKTIWYWHKNRNIDQGNRIEISEINPSTYGQLIYDKGGQNTLWKKDSLFNKWCWENWKVTGKRMKVEHYLTPYTKINSKLIKGLNIRPDTKTPPVKHKQNALWHKSQQYLVDLLPRIMTIKTQINQWDLIKQKSFCTEKETIKKTKIPT